MNFILVHIGDFFFPYIIDCINQILKFNDSNVYLIISKKHNEYFKNINVKLINIEDIKKSSKHELFSKQSLLDKSFRGGFWYYATERFFFIEDVMNQYNIDNVIHMESDNLIYFNVEEYKKVFEENYNIAAIFDNDERCIPGFMYIKNNNCISELTSFILKEHNYKNDMELLSSFKRVSNIIDNLPVIPSDYDNLISLTGKRTMDKSQYFKNIDKFNSIFDGAAIGQYIGGVDPRNDSRDTRGFINESSLFDVSKFDVSMKEINGNKIPFMNFKNKVYRINNLHIHCKRLNEYM